MDTFKARLQQIQQQLAGLSASQKMLTASLVAIMIMTILWWTRYAGTAETEPVLDQTLSADEMGRIRNALGVHGIDAKIVGDRVMVPADRRAEAMIMLTYEEALPDKGSGIWDEMFKQGSPWDSKSRTDSIQNHTRERMLGEAITSYMPGVARANVIINPVNERRIGGSDEPSASVQIRTGGHDANPKRLADAAASTVASAVSGLKKSRVNVVIDGIPRRLQDNNDSMAGSDLYDTIDAREKTIADKILGVLGTPALVAVTVDVEIASSEKIQDRYNKPDSLITENKIKSDTLDTQQAGPAGGDAGAVPNTGLNIGPPAQSAGTSTNSEKNETEMTVLPGKSTEKTINPAGKATVVSAAVRLPRSYFVNKYKAQNPGNASKDPDENTLQSMVTAELPTVRKVVKTCANIKSEEDISVDMYYDSSTMAMGGAAGTEVASSAAGLSAMVGGHAREITLGALAVISLFMVSTIVKKGTPVVAVAMETMPREAPRLATGEDVAGIVGGDGNTTLDGMELDENTVKAQQMVEQVSTLVKENPDAAANLVKRWLNRS